MHDLADLAVLAEQEMPPLFLDLQAFAVEARYEEGPFALPTSREELLACWKGSCSVAWRLWRLCADPPLSSVF